VCYDGYFNNLEFPSHEDSQLQINTTINARDRPNYVATADVMSTAPLQSQTTQHNTSAPRDALSYVGGVVDLQRLLRSIGNVLEWRSKSLRYT
jgi:hypothetical protein